MMDKETVRFTKLGTGGDFAGWKIQMEVYFKSRNYWEYVSEGQDLELDEDDDLNENMVIGKCKNDLLRSLFPDLQLTARHLDSAHEMYLKIVKIFVGTETSQKRKLRTQIDQLRFEGNFFFFLSEYESAVTQLERLQGVLA